MKIKQRTISIAAVIIIITLILTKVDWITYYPNDSYGNVVLINRESKLDALNIEYAQAEQRLQHIKEVRRKYIDGFSYKSGLHSNFIGVIKIYDDLRVKKYQHVIIFGKLGLKTNRSIGYSYLNYYTKDGQGYLSTTKLVKKIDGNHFEHIDKKVNYRYSSDGNNILIPIESKITRYLIVAFNILISIAIFVFLLIMLKLFIQFLAAISKNNAFSTTNVNRLKKMYIGLLIYSVCSYVVHGLIYLVFSIFHSTEGVIITYSFWETDYLIMIFGLVTYIIYIAFRKALLIQQESELTI